MYRVSSAFYNSISHTNLKGLRYEGALTGIKSRAPVVGGNIAAWSGLISAFTCLAVGYREKEDGWNIIFAGAATGGCLSARG